MRMKYWLMLFFGCILVSGLFFFNSHSLAVFLLSSLLVGALVFAFFCFVIKAFEAGKERKTKETITYSGLALLFIIILLLSLGFNSPEHPDLKDEMSPADFRTNIFTGKCGLEGYSIYSMHDPWYHKNGCDVKKEEKVNLMRNSPDLGSIRTFCEERCKEIALEECYIYADYANMIMCRDVFR